MNATDGILIALPFTPLAWAAGYLGMEALTGWIDDRRSRKYLESIGVHLDNYLEYIRGLYAVDYAQKVSDLRPSLPPENKDRNGA